MLDAQRIGDRIVLLLWIGAYAVASIAFRSRLMADGLGCPILDWYQRGREWLLAAACASCMTALGLTIDARSTRSRPKGVSPRKVVASIIFVASFAVAWVIPRCLAQLLFIDRPSATGIFGYWRAVHLESFLSPLTPH